MWYYVNERKILNFVYLTTIVKQVFKILIHYNAFSCNFKGGENPEKNILSGLMIALPSGYMAFLTEPAGRL